MTPISIRKNRWARIPTASRSVQSIDPTWPVQCREFLIAGRVRQDKQMLDTFSRNATGLEDPES
jgi:hypothetical protein